MKEKRLQPTPRNTKIVKQCYEQLINYTPTDETCRRHKQNLGNMQPSKAKPGRSRESIKLKQ